MLISEPAGLYIFPLAMNLARNAYELSNELNLYLVPFTIIIIYQFFSARAQGQDEGSPAVLALKRVEMSGVGMLFVLIVFVQPWPTAPKFNYSQYACSANPSIISTDTSLNDITGSQRFQGIVTNNNANLPLLTGIVHDFAGGVNGTLLSKIPCSVGSNATEVTDSLSDMIPTNEVMYESIKTFHNQCYIEALASIKSDQQKGNVLIHDAILNGEDSTNPNSKNDFFGFASIPMLDAYRGRISTRSTGAFESHPNLTIATGDNWYSSSQRNSTQSCYAVAKELDNAMGQDLESQQGYSGKKQKILKYVQMYQPTASSSDIDNELVKVMYQNVTGGVSGSREESFKEAKQSRINGGMGVNTPSLERSLNYAADVATSNEAAGNFFIDSLVYVGSFFKTIEETTKAHAALIVMPTLVVLAMGIIIACIPILSLMSGYSIQAMYQVLLMYFGLSLVPYWLNVGLLIQSIMGGMVEGQNLTSAWFGIEMLSQYITYMAPIIWLILFQVLGTLVGSAMANMLQSSTGAGEHAYKQFQAIIDQVKKGSKNSADSAFDQYDKFFSVEGKSGSGGVPRIGNK